MKADMITLCVSACLTVGALFPGQAPGAPESYPETVLVGDPGNRADSTGFGAVSYTYRIGKYEVTNEQYCEFLNAVNTEGKDNVLWRWQMGKKENGGITRSGEPGSYSYSLKEGMAQKPAVLMNWYETLHFCNWLSNGKGKGSIENGSYTFTSEWGIMTIKMPNHAALAAGKKLQWVLASEDEWYKAAYYDPGKKGGAGYWMYPAKGEKAPEANLGSEKAKDVGSYKGSPSPHGTFDQGGNVWEWNETRQSGNCGIRGGSYWFNDSERYMRSGTRYVSNPPEFVYDNYGFRVVALGGEEREAK
ncbi:MAG: SUMF1/EgtB/PvdO family nonheme iron enzyme [Kiritimatiellia bacterium]|nr:SUMF1/EgtB/PvdO family nonheme iron enzyme [Kiritimatiellia bacterium]